MKKLIITFKESLFSKFMYVNVMFRERKKEQFLKRQEKCAGCKVHLYSKCVKFKDPWELNIQKEVATLLFAVFLQNV